MSEVSPEVFFSELGDEFHVYSAGFLPMELSQFYSLFKDDVRQKNLTNIVAYKVDGMDVVVGYILDDELNLAPELFDQIREKDQSR